MQRRCLSLMVGVVIALATVSPAQSAEAVHFRTADGVKVFADYYASPNPAAPFILCFHMANANRGEYASIAPSLVNQGFQVLAIDQRSGGFAYDQWNDTAKQFAMPQDYLSAIPDFEAAIAWAKLKSPKSKVLLWGSSYAASLVIVQGAQHMDVAAVLAFSPGEYFADPALVTTAATKLYQPVFMTSTQIEATNVAAIFAAVASTEKIQFVPKGSGDHGSSALVGADADEYWQAVRAFLKKIK